MPKPEENAPDELWVASVNGGWCHPSHLDSRGIVWSNTILRLHPGPVMSGPSPEVNEMLRWIQHTAKIGFEASESGSAEETCLELILNRLNSLFGQTSK